MLEGEQHSAPTHVRPISMLPRVAVERNRNASMVAYDGRVECCSDGCSLSRVQHCSSCTWEMRDASLILRVRYDGASLYFHCAPRVCMEAAYAAQKQLHGFARW